MAVTEQIDAIRCLGASPVRKLVLPRVVAMIFIMPLLTTLADIIGCFGGALISIFEVGVTPSYAINQLITSIGFIDITHGLIKSAFFGYFIAIISCWVGMNARGGAESVNVQPIQLYMSLYRCSLPTLASQDFNGGVRMVRHC